MFERQTKKLFLAAALGPLAYISRGALITVVALISIALCSRSPRPPSLYKQLRPPKAPLQQPITIHSTCIQIFWILLRNMAWKITYNTHFMQINHALTRVISTAGFCARPGFWSCSTTPKRKFRKTWLLLGVPEINWFISLKGLLVLQRLIISFIGIITVNKVTNINNRARGGPHGSAISFLIFWPYSQPEFKKNSDSRLIVLFFHQSSPFGSIDMTRQW